MMGLVLEAPYSLTHQGVTTVVNDPRLPLIAIPRDRIRYVRIGYEVAGPATE